MFECPVAQVPDNQRDYTVPRRGPTADPAGGVFHERAGRGVDYLLYP
jgi:hypothetical protein